MTISLKSIVIGTALFLLAAFGAWAQKDAKDLYLDKCATCHGPDGMGKTAMGKKLKVVDVRTAAGKATAAAMEKVVANGKGQDMDGFGKDFSKDQIKAIVEYFRGLAK
ncbi:MAG TPA: c-type cytochrome [Bryobacteraceae bacterium]|nr:c-type cytochrome [Bryobacteraceae bacterium]